MRYHHFLEDILGQRSKVQVLRFLVNSSGEWGGREIARNVGLSHPIVHRSLRELAAHGLVVSRMSGGAVLYRSNPDHWIVLALLRPLFSRERDALQALGAFLLRRLTTPDISLILFGSVARRDERPDSDIDLLMVLPHDRRKQEVESTVLAMAAEVSRVFGNRLAPAILTRAEFRDRLRRRERWVKAVLKEGQVIGGTPLSELVSQHGA